MGSRERADAAPPASQGLAKGVVAGVGMEYLQTEVEGQKDGEGGDFIHWKQLFSFFFCTLAFFFHFLHYLYINFTLM